MFGLLPFWLRVVFILFLLIVLFWLVLGKLVLKMLSFIPFLLRKICWLFYLILEMPTAMLHKKYGSIFGKIDNALSHAGEKVDIAVYSWYKSWHFHNKIHVGKLIFVYGLCVAYVVLPSYLNTNNNLLCFGEKTYLHYEEQFFNWVEQHGWYDPTAKPVWEQDKQTTDDIIGTKDAVNEADLEETILIVSGVSNSLLMRDIPSVENCVILERLHNDDTVIWNGQMTFAKADNDHIEPWVKVTTSNGTEGWCRLFYLFPEGYEGKEFNCTDTGNYIN